MKRILLAAVLSLAGASASLAGIGDFSLPRMDFPTQGGEVTQICNPLTQSCAQD